ncbi:MAG: hypothetical protein E7415_06585 [Ruminococcaceae bacterium]|nr:hypothetical protein [Oscillospiraceae bacterium]
MYIIYVESAVILFFLIKNTDNFTLNILLKASAILWFVQSLFIKGNEGGLIISLLPYTLCGYSKKNILRFGYSALVLCVGLYALAALGNSALAGGGICILIMIILGEFYLLPLIAVISPWIIGMGIKVVQGGLNGKNIIKIGYFFWNRGFRGASPNYTSISFGTFGIFVSLLFSVISFIFFWYVLRVSRQAILKLFKKGTKNKSLIRAGLSAVIGFSFYTFFTKTENLHSNILIYLWNCALLKRMSRLSHIREETGANGRKKDLS